MKTITPRFLTLLWLGFAGRLAVAEPVSADGLFLFRLPLPAAYRLDDNAGRSGSATAKVQWLRARPANGATNFVELGSRVVVQLSEGADLQRVITGAALELSRTVASNLFILQAPDAPTAAREAHRLAARPEVLVSQPVIRRQADLNGAYAPMPTDSLFYYQWPLEHRNGDGSSAGVDINVRAAWPHATGQGVTVAVADSGVEMDHPELTNSVLGAPHYNFAANSTNALPVLRTASAAHGTEVAGLIAAQMNDARMVGVAPDARLASWVIFDTDFFLASEEQLMDMYQYASNSVSVQNHSWASVGLIQTPVSVLEQVGISNAINQGRSGRGSVMVRSAGNDRGSAASADDDGYSSDPHAIAVGAVRIDGRAASYSEPGACLLVGAPSGDSDLSPPGVFTTDLLGTDGVNRINFFPPNQDLSGYVFNNLSFSGTSAAVPHIAGIAALMLSANPDLTWRDVQQILILAARHFDFADPDVVTNGAGFVVSHNLGFGVPDAGVAVNLAQWFKRPSPTTVTWTETNRLAIPDDGLRLLVTGDGVPTELASVQCQPSTGPHADAPTATLPLVDFGYGTNAAGFNLTNKAALIQRGSNTFAQKINFAAQAGAVFAVIYNYPTNASSGGGGDELVTMAACDFVPIPAVFIGHTDGEALKAVMQTNASARAQIHLEATNLVFTVTNTLVCEHVGLRVQSDHSLRGDVRITLVSPMGTRSVLQRFNADTNAGPVDWTYYSTHHFFESSAGQWTACFSDEAAGNVGAVQSVSLMIDGVPIHDQDRDGLDDFWETNYFGSIFAQGPKDDPDHDGYSNAREQIMDTIPTRAENLPFDVDLSRWNQSRARLSWPSSPGYTYEIWGGTNVDSLLPITTLPGLFPETEWFTPYNSPARQFFRVRATLQP